MFSIVLFRPEIPPNTGNVIRLSANTGCDLHLVEPLGFKWDDRAVKRAGLDYHEFATVQRHPNWDTCVTTISANKPQARWFALTTKGSVPYDEPRFGPDDVFVFGQETSGLPDEVLAKIPGSRRLKLPMQPNSRSLNLSNTVAVMIYEAWRQTGFGGAAPRI
jgi:tRNA (cytidine/uridine-2'-O-)-methyltransferase